MANGTNLFKRVRKRTYFVIFLTVPHEIDMEVIERLLYRYSASEHKMHYELHSAL